jgi:hypothetical protein
MTFRPLADQARLESGLVILRVLSHWGYGQSWRLFGSWAIFLHSAGSTRLPQDVDVEVGADDECWVRDLPIWDKSGGLHRCVASEPRKIVFSRAGSPVAYWQDVEVSHGHTWLSTETVNWVWHGPGRDLGSIVRVDGQEVARQVGWDSSVAVPCAPLEECLALKWTRISRVRTGGRRHTRWEDLADLYDVLVLGKARVSHALLRRWILSLASERGVPSPFLLPSPPLEWLDAWDYHNFRTKTQRPRPEEATAILNELFMTFSGTD